MSLINDALKKAQKQRTGEAPTLSSMPSVGGESPQRIARRAKPAGFNTLMVRAGIGAGVLLVIVVGGYFAFRSDSIDKRSPASDQPVASAPSSVVSPPPSAQPAPAAPTFTLPVAPKTEPVAQKIEPPAPVVAKSEPKQTASQPKAIAQQPTTNNQQPAPVSEPAKPVLKLEPRAIQFIDNIKVAGIRASATDAKVLMNDRVYRVGSIVDAELGLKLVEIAAGALTFEDDRGGRYTRTF
jgi:hypothetical protein